MSKRSKDEQTATSVAMIELGYPDLNAVLQLQTYRKSVYDRYVPKNI